MNEQQHDYQWEPRTVTGKDTNQPPAKELQLEDIVEIAYDMQSGSFVRALDAEDLREHQAAYGQAIGEVLAGLGRVNSILEAGVDPFTTIGDVFASMKVAPSAGYSFDQDWSGSAHIRRVLKGLRLDRIQVCVADPRYLPFSDDAFDAVYASRSWPHPNLDETAALTEMVRVAARFVLILERDESEPSGACGDGSNSGDFGLGACAEALGLKVVRREEFPFATGRGARVWLTVIEKDSRAKLATPRYACPWFNTGLTRFSDCYYSYEGMRAYPLIGGIPCLTRESAVVSSKYPEYAGKGEVVHYSPTNPANSLLRRRYQR